jgi:hypothetical protein
LELGQIAFGLGPSFDFFNIDYIISGNHDGLFQALPVAPVVIGSQPIFYTISGRDYSQDAGGKMQRDSFFHRLAAYRERARGKLQEETCFWMSEIPPFFKEA